MTDVSAGVSLKRIALGDLSHEIATTRRVLERIPDEHLGWKPHQRSFSLGELGMHVANLFYWTVTMLRQDEFDLASVPSNLAPPTRTEEILSRFEENAAAVTAALDALDDSALLAPWTLRRGEHVILRQPRVAVVRGLGINHVVHHRGQLSVYLRLLDVPLPPMYGPTADEAR